MLNRDIHWAKLMRAANSGDAAAYRHLLVELTPLLRGLARKSFARCGLGSEDAEDVVQETLLAVHLKRHTWDDTRSLVPWVWAIAQNKIRDNLRRRLTRFYLPIEDFSDDLAIDNESDVTSGVEAERMLARLGDREREIVVAISIKGASARDVAARLGMSEGAVRVALHRALKGLAAAFRETKS